MAEFDFYIIYYLGRTNPANRPSYCPDYIKNASNNVNYAISAVFRELRAKLALAKDKFPSISIMVAIICIITQSSAALRIIVPLIKVVRLGTDSDLASYIIFSDLNIVLSLNFIYFKSTRNSELN